MNNPTSAIDPLGLDTIRCGVGAGRTNSCPVQLQNYTWYEEEFQLMNLPVVENTWIQPYQVVTTINGVVQTGPIVPGYWTTTEVGNAYTLLSSFAQNVPISGSINIPVPVLTPEGPLPGPAGVSIPVAKHVPGTQHGCVGGGWWAGTPGERAVGGGPLIFGNLSNATNILSGPSWSFNVQITPLIGFQVIWNSSGVLAGPTAGLVPGAALSRTISTCK